MDEIREVVGDEGDDVAGEFMAAYGPAGRAQYPGPAAPAVPLLADRGLVDGKPAAYVCRDFICQASVTDSGLCQGRWRRCDAGPRGSRVFKWQCGGDHPSGHIRLHMPQGGPICSSGPLFFAGIASLGNQSGLAVYH
jgi:hypothetical protein